MREFLERLKTAQTVNFGKMTDSQSRAEIITCFLVILHLIKDHLIDVQQDTHFSEITIEKYSRESNIKKWKSKQKII